MFPAFALALPLKNQIKPFINNNDDKNDNNDNNYNNNNDNDCVYKSNDD